MNNQKLSNLVCDGVVILFDNKTDFICFLKEIKPFGGKWQNGEDIVIPEEADVQSYFRVYINRYYNVAFVSGICYHYSTYPSISYAKIK
ncbi:MAG: hypothetical protein J1G07_00950 [Clostridiales bacterium]|nr:hypothetical protein [Clostridiales bacterium]